MQLRLDHEHHAVVSLQQQLQNLQVEAQSWRNEASSVALLNHQYVGEVKGASVRYDAIGNRLKSEEPSCQSFQFQLSQLPSSKEQLALKLQGEEVQLVLKKVAISCLDGAIRCM